MARPSASVLSATPGPELLVTASEPVHEEPIAAPIAAISSSAWNVTTPYCLSPASVWSSA